MIWLIIAAVVLSGLGFVLYHIIKFSNPFRLIFLFGKKGCGKSSTLCKLAFKYLKKGWKVYSTEKIPGTYLLPPETIGWYELAPKSVVLIDEVGLIWHSRDFKTFPREVRSWFKLQRHRKLRVYMCSQSFDVDKSVRDLCDEMYLLTNVFNIFSYQKRILKSFDVVQATAESPSTIVENLKIDSILLAPFGSRRFTYIPKYAKYFDSFECDPLLPFDYQELKIENEKLLRSLHLKKKSKESGVSKPRSARRTRSVRSRASRRRGEKG